MNFAWETMVKSLAKAALCLALLFLTGCVSSGYNPHYISHELIHTRPNPSDEKNCEQKSPKTEETATPTSNRECI